MTCPLLPFALTPGLCDGCGKKLTGRQKRWCGKKCSLSYFQAHHWGAARAAAVRRDNNRCITCGSTESLEVNHIAPREGRGYGFGCWNHPDNLETLCHECHVKVTNAQREARKARRKEAA